ncbi:MAG: winged helix-turn-helix transcriptional regulator [Candidatus Eremiobacteraeota bacterium]|nr:winged helix-turn-helix transcriptional regulator [Candidatus Eremiobacteraeota bacterium]
MVVRASEVTSRELPAVLRTLKREAKDQTSLYVVVCIDEPAEPDQSKKLAAIVDQAKSLNGAELPVAEHLRVGDLIVDRERFEVTRGGRRIHLSLTEFRLLETLMRNHDRVLDIGYLAHALFNGQPMSAACNILWVYIHRLRRKVDRPPCEALIQTIRRRGYMLRSPEAWSA